MVMGKSWEQGYTGTSQLTYLKPLYMMYIYLSEYLNLSFSELGHPNGAEGSTCVASVDQILYFDPG